MGGKKGSRKEKKLSYKLGEHICNIHRTDKGLTALQRTPKIKKKRQLNRTTAKKGTVFHRLKAPNGALERMHNFINN